MHIVLFKRPAGETPRAFGGRLRLAAEKLAADPDVATLILHVQDDATGAPEGASSEDRDFDAALTVDGLGSGALPDARAVYAVSRRIIKSRRRRGAGARTPGFTIVCPSVRAAFLTHAQFDAHWRERHSKIHVDSSPGTCHYEQYTVEDILTPDAPRIDGIGWLGFESAHAWETGLFDGERGQRAILEDVERFLDSRRFASFAASEYVYRDPATT
jgi:hypothetical protein